MILTYEVYAVKYAERDGVRGEHFLGGDPRPGDAMPMDYFVWVVVGGGQTWVVDTGFGPDDATRRGRTLLRTAAEAVALVGADAATVENVILTHLHYDHAGGMQLFPNATFHVQEREAAFATGRHMTHDAISFTFNADQIANFVRAVHAGRVVFHDGDAELASGLSVHHIGGHTPGLQAVRAWTRRGWLVLASDATHFYENLHDGRPFPIVIDVGAMLDGFRRLRELAGGEELIVPGHDPRVLQTFPPVSDDLVGIAARLD